MNLRNKRKISSSSNEEKEKEFHFVGASAASSDNTMNTTAASLSSVKESTNFGSSLGDKEGSPKKYNLNSNGNTFISTTDTILTAGSNPTKKMKSNSGVGVETQGSNSACLKSAEQIFQNQKAINNDTDIDCDGFLEIFPQDLHTQLPEAIHTEQTIVLRNAAGPNGYNVNPKNLFNFESVVKNHSELEIECRIQNPTVYGFNVENPKNSQHVYSTTIKEYGEYANLLESDKYDEIKKKSYYKEYFSKLSNGVMFAVNIDMDDFSWKTENMRLRSGLPHFLLNKGKHDMLSYHRQNVMGCTQPQMYLKVAGVWTGGHQENISVRAININHGKVFIIF